MKKLKELKLAGLAPEWYKIEGFKTISQGYLFKDETPKDMYIRVASSAAKHLLGDSKSILGLTQDQLQELFFTTLWNNWLCPASPVLSNSGLSRGLTISCFGITPQDSISSIMAGASELAALTKVGGGVGVSFDAIRPRGTPIKGGDNGSTEGIIPFAKIYDSTIIGINQGSRRGAAVINLNVNHKDFPEFLDMRKPKGDIHRQCGNIHHCALIPDEFLERVFSGDLEAQDTWSKILKTRFETGEPYIVYIDTVTRADPDSYKALGLKTNLTNLCSEITLHTDEDHSFICCLSSLNLANWEEWKTFESHGLTLPQIATLFLNGVLNEFIQKGSTIPNLEKVVRHAKKGRAIGIGVLGWHTLLQEKGIPFESFNAMQLNSQIFRFIDSDSLKTTKALAQELGEPEWCVGSGRYNSHRIAIAPTRSNSTISGGVSFGIEPMISNAFTDKSSKGLFYRKNPLLKKVLKEKYDQDNKKVWKTIIRAEGSVQGLDFLSPEDKEVFLTAYEINPQALIRQAAQRQKYVCQSQSLNLFFNKDVDPVFYNQTHLLAWKLGVKTLYYCRSEAGLKVTTVGSDECKACES